MARCHGHISLDERASNRPLSTLPLEVLHLILRQVSGDARALTGSQWGALETHAADRNSILSAAKVHHKAKQDMRFRFHPWGEHRAVLEGEAEREKRDRAKVLWLRLIRLEHWEDS